MEAKFKCSCGEVFTIGYDYDRVNEEFISFDAPEQEQICPSCKLPYTFDEFDKYMKQD